MHHTAVRALAYKWQRILHRCWKDSVPYDDARYLAALRKQGSPLIPRIEALSKTIPEKPIKPAKENVNKSP